MAPSKLAEDLEMLDADDTIEEYNFTDVSEAEDEEDDGRDTESYKNPNGIITISDDDGDEVQEDFWQASHCPWREKGFTVETRKVWESMYCKLTNFPMGGNGGDWEVTEEYMREKDKEMARYLEDFPIHQWVIPRTEAEDAYSHLVERTRWRNLGIRIYGSRSVPGGMPGITPPHHSSNMRTVHMRHPSTGQAASGHRSSQQMTMSMAQQLPPHLAGRPVSEGLPHGVTSRGMPPPAPNVLHSQPNAQPMPTYPNGMPAHAHTGSGRPAGAPSDMANGAMPHPGHMQGAQNQQMAPRTPPNKGKAREKKTTSLNAEVQPAQPPPPTPPYERRAKPTERKVVNKSGRQNKRRQAEADIFPWNRDIDFKAARSNASWNDDIYDTVTLDEMSVARQNNVPVIERIDRQETERQRNARNAKKKQSVAVEVNSDTEKPKRGSRKKASKLEGGDTSTGDPYHSGSFCFATQEDEDRAVALSKNTPDDIMDAYEDGTVTLNACAQIKISWNPGKRGITQDLTQGRFSIKDNILTRQQLENTAVLTRRAAECIVDFCPDMLWREMLLRIASEAGFGNKDIRDRMCHNGNYCDKATITKRIGAALGQKQQQSTAKRSKKGKSAVKVEEEPAGEPSDLALAKTKGYAKGEDDYYNENVKDFASYVEFFGKRTSHRTQLKIQAAGSKRKLAQSDGSDDSVEDVKVKPRKRAKAEEATTDSPEMVIDSDETTEAERGSESESEGESEDNADAVSVQSDTVLDQMDDD